MAKENFEREGMDDITISLEVARLAKQKGYPGQGTKDFWYRLHRATNFHCASKEGMYKETIKSGKQSEVFAEYYPACTKDSMQRWLRLSKNIKASSTNPALLRGLEQLPDVKL